MASIRRIEVLDGWRGVAVLFVLIGHFIPLPGSEIARLGVELFFVLSGRLMAQILISNASPLGIFYWRRFSRIMPGLLFFVLVVYVFSMLGIFAPSKLDYLSASTMWSNYFYTFNEREPVFGHTWSLAIEEHSYVLLGFIALAVTRSPQKAILISGILIIIGFGRGLWLTYHQGLGYYEVFWRTDVRAASLMSGFFFYLVYHTYGSSWIDGLAKISRGLLCLYIGVILIQFCSLVPDTLKYTIGTLMVAGLLIAVEEYSKRAGHGPMRVIASFLSRKSMIFMGTISYSTYLYQQIFHAIKGDVPYVLNAFFIPLAILIGYMSWRFIEVPARSTLNNIGLRKAKSKAEA